MKKFGVLGIVVSLFLVVSCGKQETEAERNAEIERQIQQRLAAERQAAEQQKLAQREADVNARESALVQKEQEATAQSATPQMRTTEIQQRDIAEAERHSEPLRDEQPEGYNTFYTKLEQYGAWRETSNYGYVWQPNEAERSRNWRPYTNGRWVYTDAGWAWDSEEPFGWATYHYGRWTRLRNVGWIWIPGDEWAPGWVSWRKSNDFVGWAPLPPEARFDHRTGIQNLADNSYDIGPERYCFVPTNDFGEQQIEHTVVPVERNVTIVTQTTNVTNITYNNTNIVNQGPNYDELRGRTRHPIPRLRLERRANFGNENPRSIVRGEVIEMSAPAIAPARPADRPHAVKEKITQPEIDHGWAGNRDEQATEKTRTKMKAEATPPPGAPPRSNVIQGQPQQTPVAPASATPVRNFPQPAKITPRPTTTATPSAAATATVSPNKSAARREKIEAERQMKQAQKAQKEKSQQQKIEEQRKAKAAKTQSPPPATVTSTAPRPIPPVKPSPTVAAPAVTATPRVPLVKPTAAKLPAAPKKAVSPGSKATPAPTAGGETKKSAGDKRKKKDRQNPSPSPTATAR
jgi:hypothetical protein